MQTCGDCGIKLSENVSFYAWPSGFMLCRTCLQRAASDLEIMCKPAGPSALKEQIGGTHYKVGGIQPVEYIEANNLPFLEGCVVKRVTRHARDGGKGRQDIEKAIHELTLLLQLRYGAGDR